MAYSTKPVLQVYEVFERVTKAKTKKERVEVLKSNESWALKDVIRGIFDDRVQWNLPPGEPPYTPSTPDSYPRSLLKQNTEFKYFVKGIQVGDSLPTFKRESIFLGMLETVHPEDAKILVSMINKKNPVKGLTKSVIKEAFPSLIPES